MATSGSGKPVKMSIALVLVVALLWTGVVSAEVQFVMPGQPAPGEGIWMPTLSAEKLIEDLRDRDKMRASLGVKEQELENLRLQLANKDGQIKQLEAAIAAEKEAWVRADERDKIRQDAAAAMKAALDMCVATSQSSIAFMKQQQDEIDSQRKKSFWMTVVSVVAAIGFGALFLIK